MKMLETTNIHNIQQKIESVKALLSQEVYRRMSLCLFHPGEYLYTEGARSDRISILLDGRCKVFKTMENGKSILLCYYEDIQILGEFELFGDPAAKTTVQALKDTYCLSVSVTENRNLLLADNQFLQFVCRQTCAKADRNSRSAGINLLYPLEQRLAGYILLMQENNIFTENHTLLAEYLGCSHRHLLRTFASLCEKKLLEKKETTYYITDQRGLEILAGNIYQN